MLHLNHSMGGAIKTKRTYKITLDLLMTYLSWLLKVTDSAKMFAFLFDRWQICKANNILHPIYDKGLSVQYSCDPLYNMYNSITKMYRVQKPGFTNHQITPAWNFPSVTITMRAVLCFWAGLEQWFAAPSHWAQWMTSLTASAFISSHHLYTPWSHD